MNHIWLWIMWYAWISVILYHWYESWFGNLLIYFFCCSVFLPILIRETNENLKLLNKKDRMELFLIPKKKILPIWLFHCFVFILLKQWLGFIQSLICSKTLFGYSAYSVAPCSSFRNRGFIQSLSLISICNLFGYIIALFSFFWSIALYVAPKAKKMGKKDVSWEHFIVLDYELHNKYNYHSISTKTMWGSSLSRNL